MFQVALDAARAAFFSSSAAYQLFWIVLSTMRSSCSLHAECLDLLPSVNWFLLMCLNWCFVAPWTAGPVHQPTTRFCMPRFCTPGLLAGRAAQTVAAGLSKCLCLTYRAAIRAEKIGLEGEMIIRGKGTLQTKLHNKLHNKSTSQLAPKLQICASCMTHVDW